MLEPIILCVDPTAGEGPFRKSALPEKNGNIPHRKEQQS
jgi:hypothetical protein